MEVIGFVRPHGCKFIIASNREVICNGDKSSFTGVTKTEPEWWKLVEGNERRLGGSKRRHFFLRVCCKGQQRHEAETGGDKRTKRGFEVVDIQLHGRMLTQEVRLN